MRFNLLFMFVLVFSGCGSDLETTNNNDSTSGYNRLRPTSYSEATWSATTGRGTQVPVGAWQVQSVTMTATPGTVFTLHNVYGEFDFTARIDGTMYDSRGYSLDLLMHPNSTIWLTLKSPVRAVVYWAAVDFISLDSKGATYTAPIAERASINNNTVHIHANVVVSPSGNG